MEISSGGATCMYRSLSCWAVYTRSPPARVSSVGKRSVYALVMMMTRPVMEQITMVSMNGSSRATTPSETGSSVFRRGVGDGRRSLPRLVGEEAPPDTPHEGHHEHARTQAGDACRRVERLLEDQHQ